MTGRSPVTGFWQTVGTRFLPFADAASADLPLSRLLRLALFQISVGIAVVLLNGTLNRVLIVELGAPTWIVALMIGLPLLVAPLRALIGHRSDMHRSAFGWRRVPYIWFGTLAQFGGLAIMPFALVLLSRPDTFAVGVAASSLAFLLTGGGMHVTQTAGLALATDLAPEDKRPRVVALLYVMLLVGMMLAAFTIGNLLGNFSTMRLIQIIQGAALLTFVLNIIALWKQEPRSVRAVAPRTAQDGFLAALASFTAQPGARRLLLAIGIGTAAFSMQDALLEPYGGEILGLAVGSTTALTGVWALGALAAFAWSGRQLTKGSDPLRLAGLGGVAGIAAFLMALFAAPIGSAPLLFVAATVIGFGTGLFSVGTMVAAMGLVRGPAAGIALGAWGTVQATAAGAGVAFGGIARDAANFIALRDGLGPTLAVQATGYAAVYLVEIMLLLLALAVLGPVVGRHAGERPAGSRRFGLGEFPT